MVLVSHPQNCTLQVKNISNLFKLDPPSIYLVDSSDNMVLFPLESGKFKVNQVVVGYTYEVHGSPLDAASATPQYSTSTPYGAYTNPTFQASPPPPHPPRSSKMSKIKKTILLISLSKKGKDKAKGSWTTRLSLR